VLLVITIAICVAVVNLRESRHHGRELREWLWELDSWNRDTNAPVARAIRGMGTNAIPILVSESLWRDTTLRRMLEVNAELHPKILPHFTTASERSGRANVALKLLGEQARVSFPYFLTALTNQNPDVRRLAAGALGQLGSEAELCIPALIERQNDRAVRSRVMLALGCIGKRPDICVPVLAAGLCDPEALTRDNAASSLAQFGSQARAATPALIESMRSLMDGNESRRTIALLKQIDPDAAAKARLE
jgi:HEAT repeat protein